MKDYKALYAKSLYEIKKLFDLSKEEEEIIIKYIDNIIVEFQDVHEKILEKNNFVNLIELVDNIIKEEDKDG